MPLEQLTRRRPGPDRLGRGRARSRERTGEIPRRSGSVSEWSDKMKSLPKEEKPTVGKLFE